MEKLTRENIKIEPLLRGSVGEDFSGIEKIPDSMLDVMLNGPTVMSIKKGEFRGMARQLYAALQAQENNAVVDNPLLTVEQLKQNDGKPVWLVTKDFQDWRQYAYEESKYGLIAFWQFGDEEEDTFDIKEYGKSIFAYARKPDDQEERNSHE